MGKKNVCHLCGAKLQRGYCRDCGFDVGRSEKIHYRLNESNSISSINGKSVSKRRGQSPNVMIMEANEQPALTVKNAAKTTKQINRISKELGHNTSSSLSMSNNSSNMTQNYQLVSPNVLKDNQKKNAKIQKKLKRERSKKRGSIRLAGVIIVAIFALSSLIINLIDEFSYQDDFESSYFGDYEYSYDEDYANDPYDMVTRELSETGEMWDESLSAGEYIVGTHLPEGNYTVTLVNGTGYFSVDDYENGIYLWESFGEEEEYDEILEMQDVRLYQNATFSISEGLVLNFETESAQIDAMDYIENPLTETLVMDEGDTFTAGVDFPAGVYDVTCEDESVWFTYRIPANPEWYEEGYNEYYLWLNPDDNSGSYSNVIFPEGTEITAEDAGVILTPSEKINSTDYGIHYDYYIYE